jgi:hypothetical protein
MTNLASSASFLHTVSEIMIGMHVTLPSSLCLLSSSTSQIQMPVEGDGGVRCGGGGSGLRKFSPPHS